ncbi:MAG: hypothetical protein ACTSY1_12785 [Alphaproteobacteria bacterium]
MAKAFSAKVGTTFAPGKCGKKTAFSAKVGTTFAPGKCGKKNLLFQQKWAPLLCPKNAARRICFFSKSGHHFCTLEKQLGGLNDL